MAEVPAPEPEETTPENPRHTNPQDRRMRFIGFNSRDRHNFDDYERNPRRYEPKGEGEYPMDHIYERDYERRENPGRYNPQDYPRHEYDYVPYGYPEYRRGVPGTGNPHDVRNEYDSGELFPPQYGSHRYTQYQQSPEAPRYRYAPMQEPMRERHHIHYIPGHFTGQEQGYGGSSFYQYPNYPQGNPGHSGSGGGGNQRSNKMSEGINTDKVIVNTGGGGGESGAALAGLIAAMNSGGGNDSNAALIAALTANRGHNDMASLALLADRRHDDGFGFGGGLGALVLLALLGGRGRGFLGGGGDGDGCGAEIVLSKLGSIEGAVPLAAANVTNAICNATGEITNTINQSSLANLAAIASAKDATQVGVATLLQAGNSNTKEILGAICNLSSKIDQNVILDLQRQLGVAEARATEDRLRHHSDGVEIRVSQNVNQAQAQAQLQLQQQRIDDDRFNRLFAGFASIANQFQRSTQAADVINFGSGTIAGSGIQSQNSNQVR